MTLTLALGLRELSNVVLLFSKLGTSSLNFLHNWAYIELYLGSSKAFSNINKMTPFKIGVESRPRLISSSLNFSNFSGVILLSILQGVRVKKIYIKFKFKEKV